MTPRARALLETSILPWWEDNGADDELGGVRTCFSNDGTLLTTDKYTWSQGRWAWLCAHIARDGRAGMLSLDPEPWARRSRATSRFLVEHVLLDGPVTAFRAAADGSAPTGAGSSVLADLFAALGLIGGAAVAEGQSERALWTDTATALLCHAERRIVDRVAPSEPYPVRPGFAAAAPLMLLLNVGTELHEITGCRDSAAVVDRALTGFLGDAQHTGLWQRDRWWELRPDRAEDRDTLLARHVTPGHLLEALWMAVHAARARGDRALPEWLPDLAVRCLELGWDNSYGGVFRYVDGHPARTPHRPVGRLFGDDHYETLVQQSWDVKLWWVHVEALYATRLLALCSGRRDLAEWYRRIRDYTLATFPSPDGQEWLQVRDRQGLPLDQVVALPVKDPFHIARALLLLNRIDAHLKETG
ncbi:AGE family epimerase/isomerase [Sciscionella marina]|uniref:AGE family epimerase/isomerase n=1 Tax=Sciscionella marina TaxID=508770 RepID=UPI0003780C10|nr:AGE family epimerase/isomerase [Sciscionella marina]